MHFYNGFNHFNIYVMKEIEIKFRGLRLDRSEFVKGNYMRTVYKDRDDKIQIYPPLYNVPPVDVIPDTVGQYIGHSDEFGKEIYKGDVLISPLGEMFKISQRSAMFILENRDGITRGINYNLNMWKIIGNIHQNPELL